MYGGCRVGEDAHESMGRKGEFIKRAMSEEGKWLNMDLGEYRLSLIHIDCHYRV